MKEKSTDCGYVPAPVRVVNLANDVVEIEGVKFSGDFFRTLALPDANALYRFRRTSDCAVMVEKQNP